MKYEKWSYIANEFIDKKTLKIEGDEGDLKLYEYFSTLRWRWCYAIVYKDNLLRECEEMPYDEWDMAVEMMKLLRNEREEKEEN